ncbi:Phosphoribosyl-ATP pyrophosphatase [Bacillus cereus AH676]|nr:Phosphoribosyl-ATP pyrophosphatase [Bacillus cereus BDRD-Cer4]EEL77348.1 Phosphoribosyl-ATP pyrophosphatase [Bacillus cereus AH676]
MLAYMNEEAYKKTLETKRTWFYSRSRQSLWNKGETSGNVQYVQSLYLDCDQDSIVVNVKQVGPACHTGEKTCFYYQII